MENEERRKLTAEEVCGKINENTTIEDIECWGFSKKEAEYLHALYNAGADVYKLRYYHMKFQYEKLCIAVCEKLLMK